MNEDDWQPGSAQEEEQTEAARVSRRRWGSGRRTRPRPLSDYGQLASRSLSIPEDAVAADPPGDDHVDGMQQPRVTTTGQDARAPSGCSMGGWRRRPISVIGGVSFYGNTQAEDVENLLVQVRAGVSNHGQQRLLAPCLCLPCRLNWTLLFLLGRVYLLTPFPPAFDTCLDSH